MTHSYKHTPRAGNAVCDSEKADKQKAHRKWRRLSKYFLGIGAEVLPSLREVSDIWGFGKDGKRYFDPVKYPYIIRK